MLDFLDIRTLFFIGAINAFICALMMIGSRRLHPPSRPALLWAGATTITLGAAMALVASRGHLPDTISILLANTLASIGALGIYQSFRLLCLRKPRHLPIALVALVIVTAHASLGTSYDNHEARIAITCMMQFAMAALTVPMLLRRRGIDAPMPLNWSICVMATFGTLNLLRLAAVIRQGVAVDSGGMLAGSVMQTVAITLYALGPMAFALAFIGIVNARIAGDLRRLAITDSLTGLLTRRGFHDRAALMLERSEGQTGSIALMMIDIDHFKSINDRFGHGCGDRVLRRFGRLLEEILPSRAIACRHGGEEFCVMIECGDADAARRLAESICERVRAESVVDGEHRIRLSVSIGVATDPFDGTGLDRLLTSADRRAYFAKDSGRGCVIADDDVSTQVRHARDFAPS
ncbi:MAG: GGDEF domain-containing protein [Burkholderiaceae bacterium]|jgi:diguanylate cyclase (GGDEF)-like protein|nr:GGDEF domain-containing protein [Burkholderiaceae bacterium]MEB2318162.1 GGDEF domain-containing protein [Pseudomonadota bacterium]